MKSHFSIVSLLIVNRFGYLDHHYDFINVFDPGGVLMFLTKMQVRIFNHLVVWITIFDPGEASTINDGAFFVQFFSYRSQEDSYFCRRHRICNVIRDLLAVLRLPNGFTSKMENMFSQRCWSALKLTPKLLVVTTGCDRCYRRQCIVLLGSRCLWKCVAENWSCRWDVSLQ